MRPDILSHSNLLDEEIHSTFKTGSLYSAVMGLSSACLLSAMQWTGMIGSIEVPILWTVFGGLYSLGVFLIARARKLKGLWIPFALIGFTTLPTSIYVISHWVLPSGAATYITGPPSYLYFCMIAVSGFAFDPKISTIAGIVSALQYVGAFLIDRDHLRITSQDPLMLQDLTSTSIYLFKGMMMVFTGLVVAVLATTAKKLIQGIVAEEKEKFSIKRVLGEYVSPEVADKIVASQKIAEKKQVAILFSDIRSFTSFSEHNEPDAIVERLNEYFSAMVSAIEKNGGTVDKFIGDAVMSVFGGVLPLENPSEAALNAARQMRASLKELQRGWASTGQQVFDNGIGIHFGEVLQGTLGSEGRKDFTVIGDAVNTASRLEGLCKETNTGILISAQAVERIPESSRVGLRSLGKFQVKGKVKEIEIYGE